MKKLLSMFLVVLLVSTMFVGCSDNNEEPKEEYVTVQDMYGNSIEIVKNPQKVACVSRTTYDFLIAFGLGDKIDGVYENVLANTWVQELNPTQEDYFAYEYNPSAETYISRDVDLIFSPEERITVELRKLGLPAMTVNHYGPEEGYDNQMFFLANLVVQLWGEDTEVVEKVEYWKNDITTTIDDITNTLDENNIEEGKSIHYVRADKKDKGITYTENTRPYLEYIYRLLKVRTIGQDLESNKISAEELLVIDPDYIVIGGIYQNGAVEASKVEPMNKLTAVKEGNVLTIPVGISQFEHPSSIASVFIKDQANKLYPELFDYDIAKLTKEAYKYYYNIDLTDEQTKNILEGKNPDGQYE